MIIYVKGPAASGKTRFMRNVIAGEKINCEIHYTPTLAAFKVALAQAAKSGKQHLFCDEIHPKVLSAITMEASVYPCTDIFLSVESLNRFTITGPQAAIRKYSKYIP